PRHRKSDLWSEFLVALHRRGWRIDVKQPNSSRVETMLNYRPERALFWIFELRCGSGHIVAAQGSATFDVTVGASSHEEDKVAVRALGIGNATSFWGLLDSTATQVGGYTEGRTFGKWLSNGMP